MPLNREQLRQQALAEKVLREKLQDRLSVLERKVDRLVAAPASAGTGATSFLGLSDAPSDYTGHAGKLVRVNSTPDGLEFVALSSLDHGGLGGLSDDDHTQYALLAGRSGGQTLNGGTASGNNLNLRSTSHSTKGKIIFGAAGNTAYDEANERLGVGTASPTTLIHAVAASGGGTIYAVSASGSAAGLAAHRPDSNWLRLHAGGSNVMALLFGNGASMSIAEADPSSNPYDNNFPTITNHLRIISGGNIGVGTTSPSAKLDINSDVLRLRTAKTPASAGASGNAGDICWDSNFIYVCVSTNTWKRVAISTW